MCFLHIKPFFLLVDIQHTQCPQCDPPTHPTTYLTHPPIREPTIHNSYTHHQPMHEPPCVYNNRTAVQNRAAETHPLTTHKPTMTLNCAYNSTAVQPYSRKKKKKKEAESGVWTHALLVNRWAKIKYSDQWLFAVSGRPNLKTPRSPSLIATAVLSPGIPTTAAWVGLGAVARSRGIGWRPGAAGVEKTYLNPIKLKIPMTLTMLTTQAYWTLKDK